MKKTMILIISLIALTFITSNAFSGDYYGKGKRGCPGYGQGYGNPAWQDLSKDQKDELNTLHQQFIDDTYKTRNAMFQKRNEIRMLMETSNPKKEDLVALSEQIADLKKEVMAKRIDFHLAAKQIAPELNWGQGMGHGGYGKCGRKGGHGHGYGGCAGKGKGYGDCPWQKQGTTE